MKVDTTMELETSRLSTAPYEYVADAAFAEWSDDRAQTTPKPLTQWLTERPSLSADLIAWASSAPVTECLPETTDARGEARTLTLGRSVVAEMRARYTTQAASAVRTASSPATIASLYAQAAAQGLNPKALANALGVGLTLVAKLNQRLLLAASLPEAFVNRAAETLHLRADDLRAYLQQPPSLAAGASYKADAAPQASPQQTWAQAVQSCSDMTPEQKALWLP